MYVNDDLNLVLTIKQDDNEHPLVTAYHTPISRAVFESHYSILAATKSKLASKGTIYMMDSGPRIAAMTLRDEAKDDERPKDTALLAEIKRLTMIVSQGSEPLPVDSAIASGIIDDEEWQDTLSEIVFFTCLYALAKKAEKSRIADAIASVLNASITASPLTEYASSLKPSMPEKPSRKAVSSVPA